MPRDKKPLPALDNASIIRNPDLSDISNRNYTDTILRYGGLATKFPQLDTDAKTIVAAINELYYHSGGSVVIPNPPIDNSPLLTESGDTINTENGEPITIDSGSGAAIICTEDDQYLCAEDGLILITEGSEGGTPVGQLNAVSIDGDIYTIPGGNSYILTGRLPAYESYVTFTDTPVTNMSLLDVYIQVPVDQGGSAFIHYDLSYSDISINNKDITLYLSDAPYNGCIVKLKIQNT